MAGFNFEGQVDSLSLLQQEFICEVIEKRGFKNNKIIIEAVGKAGDNYIANVKRIIVCNNGGDLKMIAKIAPTNPIARARSGIEVMFMNESAVYRDILPKFAEIQKVNNVTKENLFRYAECYGVLTEAPHEMILLEDLQLSEFKSLDRFKPLTNECVRMILKNFAIFHSLSLVFAEQDPENFAKDTRKLIDFFGLISKSRDFKYYLANVEKDAIEVLDDDQFKTAIRGSVSKMSEELETLAKAASEMKYSVVIQGDAWTNNMMFRLQNNLPLECVMIDYQLSKVSNPVCDILYMLFACTDYESRQKHYNQWVNYYHSELKRSLANYDIEVENIYPRVQLNEDLKKYSKLYFANAIMMFSILIRKTEDAAKVKEAIESGDRSEAVLESFKTNNLDDESVLLFKTKIEGLVNTYRELGYLD